MPRALYIVDRAVKKFASPDIRVSAKADTVKTHSYGFPFNIMLCHYAGKMSVVMLHAHKLDRSSFVF
jgi:hypothetical protein